MKIIFFGTPPFASQILERVLDHGIEVVAVVTKPDKPRGRSNRPRPSAVKRMAAERLPEVPVFQPEKISSPEYYKILREFDADLFVVVAFGEIIAQPLLDMPKYGCINVHASLLPQYRGAAPIQRALLDGVQETGVSIMYLVKKMDAGDVISRAVLPVEPNLTAGELEEQLCLLGAGTLLDVLDRFADGPLSATPQSEEKVTFAPKVAVEDAEIDWNASAEQVHNTIRAFSPKPCAWCLALLRDEKRRLKIGRSLLVSGLKGVPGTLRREGKQLFASCGQDGIEIVQLQLEGKKMMTADEFLRGFDISDLELVVKSVDA